MKDDIETLREFIAGASPFVLHVEALTALERLVKERGDFLEMVNELDAVYAVLGTADAEGGDPAAHTIDCLLSERDSLRAKLEKARPIIAEYVKANPKHKPWNRPEQDPMGAHALLSELSADAPAQPQQISDEAVLRAHNAYFWASPTSKPLDKMRAAIAALRAARRVRG